MRTWRDVIAVAGIIAVATPVSYALSGNIPADPGRGHGQVATSAPAHKLVTRTLPTEWFKNKQLKAKYKVLEANYKTLQATTRSLCFANTDLDARNRDLLDRLQTALATIRSLTEPSPPAPDSDHKMRGDDVLHGWERYCVDWR